MAFRRRFLRVAALTLVPLLCLAAAGPAGAAEKPNVLLLLADDQRADTIAALGNTVIKTPNLDSLVESGFAMSRAYCLGSNMPAVCTPSRNMLLSGRAYFRWEGKLASGSAPNFPDTMRQAGYETYHHGKRGNTAPDIQKRFQHNKYLADDERARRSGQPGAEIVDDAIAFLRKRDGKTPFCMYLAFAAPHDPRVAAEEYMSLYRRDEIPLPENYLPVHPFDNGEMTVRDEQLAPWPRSEDEIRRQLHEYYAVISGLDHHIGRLLAELKERGEYENTIIIFSSDNGLALGSHGLMGKQSLYEHSMRIPLVVAGPGIRPGDSDALVYLMDVFPTVCDLVGAPTPVGLDGQSFAAVLKGDARKSRDAIVLAYRDVQRAVGDGRWKLIRYPRINRNQLFDLQTDPHETTDLAGKPEHARRIDRMLLHIGEWQREMGDDVRLTSEEPKDPTFTPPGA